MLHVLPDWAKAVVTIFGIFSVVGLLCWLMAWANDYLEGRTPPYRRELEATYASVHRFLMTVQAVVVRRLQE